MSDQDRRLDFLKLTVGAFIVGAIVGYVVAVKFLQLGSSVPHDVPLGEAVVATLEFACMFAAIPAALLVCAVVVHKVQTKRDEV